MCGVAALVCLWALSGLLADGSSGAAYSTFGSGGPVAELARTVYLREYATLTYVREDGTGGLIEQGSAWGTFSGMVTAHFQIAPGRVNAVFKFSPRGGSVTGRAYARFVNKGSTGYYGGTLQIVKATGRYRHASGRSIGISGTIVRRYPFTLTVKANGWIKY